MGESGGRVVCAAVACLLCLGGCKTSISPGDHLPSAASNPSTSGSADASGGTAPVAVPNGPSGRDPDDDLSLGKKYFRTANFSLAERHFRRAVEHDPHDLESWLGLAASYDRLRQFDLADRAYDQAETVAGPQAEILNNRGYSYMLRGDYARARATLLLGARPGSGQPLRQEQPGPARGQLPQRQG